MKNLEKKALPDLPLDIKNHRSHLKLVSKNYPACMDDYDDYSIDKVNDFAFDLDAKINDYIKFRREEFKQKMESDLQEIIKQESRLFSDELSQSAKNYIIENHDYNYDIDTETGEIVYCDPYAETGMDDAADQLYSDAMVYLSIEAFQIAKGNSEIF